MRLANDSGSVYRRKDGRWVASFPLDGRRVNRYARSEEEARRLLPSTPLEGDATLSVWLDTWLVGADLRSTTRRQYRLVLNRLTPTLGATEVRLLTDLQIAAALAGLAKAGCGSRVVRQAYSYLKIALNAAVALGLIDENPISRLRKPMHQAGERPYWSAPQARVFITAASRSRLRYAGLLLLMVTTGLRIGEALGLEWADIDLDAGLLRIR